MTLSQCIDKLVLKHGSLRAAARAAGVDVGYLSRLRSGAKDNPDDRILAALGIERVTSYRVSRKPAKPFIQMPKANAAAYHGGEDDGH